MDPTIFNLNNEIINHHLFLDFAASNFIGLPDKTVNNISYSYSNSLK